MKLSKRVIKAFNQPGNYLKQGIELPNGNTFTLVHISISLMEILGLNVH